MSGFLVWLVALLSQLFGSGSTGGGGVVVPPTGPGMCADGSWGYVGDPGDAIHVRDWGDDQNGDGSLGDPFASVEKALSELSKNPTTSMEIAVGPGDFPTQAKIHKKDLAGTRIAGCGQAETWLSAEDDDKSILDVRRDVEVAGVRLVGGTDAYYAHGDGFSDLEAVEVRGSRGTSIRAKGKKTELFLTDTVVRDTLTENGCGWGVWAKDSPLAMVGGGVYNANEVGVYAEKSSFWIKDIEVDGTAPRADGTLGRGLQTEEAYGYVGESSFTNNTDSSVFMRRPNQVIIGSIVIDITGAGILATGKKTGDGVVVIGDSKNPGTYSATISQNIVTQSDRAALVLQDVEAVVSGNLANGSGTVSTLGAQAFRQGVVAVTGTDVAAVMDLGAANAATALPIDTSKVTCP